MGLFKKPKSPPPPTPAPDPGQEINNQVQNEQKNAALDARLAGGVGSTMLTGSRGLAQTATNAPKTLLGG